jgi:hypothetical protein
LAVLAVGTTNVQPVTRNIPHPRWLLRLLLHPQATLVAAMGVGVVAQRRRWHAVPESLVLMLGGVLLGAALRRQVR